MHPAGLRGVDEVVDGAVGGPSHLRVVYTEAIRNEAKSGGAGGTLGAISVNSDIEDMLLCTPRAQGIHYQFGSIVAALTANGVLRES